MKNKLIIATSFLLVAAGTAAASPMEMSFDDDFFGDDPFFDDDSSEADSSDDFFGGDDFFSDDESSDDSDASEGDVGVCVIGVDSPCNSEEYDGDNETDDNTDDETDTVSEERRVTPAPEPDGVGENWISYPNPRDHVLDYDTISEHGDIKVCQVLLNEENQVITGETVEDTTFAVDTNISEGVPQYEDSNPILFETPLNQVADLIGTSNEYREGDGMLDAECAEYHNLPFGTYTYSNQTISGEHADEIDFVGLTEYWDDRPEGNPFNMELNDYGENELSDGQLKITPDEDNNHAEVIFVNRIKG